MINMYITKENLEVIYELTALVAGSMETLDDDVVDYWVDFLERTENLKGKIAKTYDAQETNKKVKIIAHKLIKEIKDV